MNTNFRAIIDMQLSDRTIGGWLEYWAKATPNKECIVYSDRDLRFT